MKTLIIKKDDISRLIDIEKLKTELIEGFKNYSKGASRRDGQRIVLDICNGNKTTLLGPGTSADIPAYTTKVNSKFPNEATAIKGVIALFDDKNGNLLALLDSSLITAIRTGLCAAIATDCLSDPKSRQIGIIGAGKQNILQLQYLLELRTLEKAKIYDLKKDQAEKFADMFKNKLECAVVDSLSECVADTDIILTATWSKTPILNTSLIKAPCHITSLGSDEKGKVEVSEELVANTKFYCDDVDLNMAMGTPGNLGLTREFICAEIGEVFSYPNRGRNNAEETTIYSSVGLPFQDLITSWHLYTRALDDENIASLQIN